jgi:protoporphyrinogen IX oxidase
MNYLIAFHLIAIVCWFAGLFYLPRLFVYHAMTTSREVGDVLTVMEHKLYFYIMTPALFITVATGIYLLTLYLLTNPVHSGWLWLKLFLVFFLMLYHFACGYYLYAFKEGSNTQGHRFFRIFNEVPTVFLIAIMILAVVQPF